MSQEQATDTVELFPAPTRPASVATALSVPRRWPGRSPASTAALVDILKDNNKRWHIFFNDRGFHNHTAHTVLALWSIGANDVILKAAYDLSSAYMLPAFESPSQITKQNWRDHLGDKRYYQAYMTFFTDELKEKGTDRTLEEYIFAPQANFISGVEKQPEMLNRVLDSLIHPMIHIGNGLEFNVSGLVVEGLAMTAIHEASSINIIPASLFDSSDTLLYRFATSVGLTSPRSRAPPADVHVFTVMSRILKDPDVGNFADTNLMNLYSDVMKTSGESIKKYVDQWTLDGDIEKKVEELIWLMTLLYAVGGSQEGETFNADFFYAHFVTSSLFLSTWISHLNPTSQRLFLRSYLSVCLTWYIGRGRPSLDIARFFSNPDTLRPTPLGPLPTPDKHALASSNPAYAITPNPWLPIIQTSSVHPDEHIPKIQRSFAHFGELFEHVEAGYFKETELDGAELIDGTLFLRAAGLTANRAFWIREGQKPDIDADWSVWDRRGFFTKPEL